MALHRQCDGYGCVCHLRAAISAPSAASHHPQGVPRYLANLWTTYDFSLAGIHGFQAGIGLNYQDKTYSDNTDINSIPPSTIPNAELAYCPRPGT